MLQSNRGFTIIQFIAGMTVGGLLLVGIFVYAAKGEQRESQRKSDLGLVDAMIGRYAEVHHGKYPITKQATIGGSELHMEFDALHLYDPKSGKAYVLGSDFGDCDSSADISELGPGYISYRSPGKDGPYSLRICLEKGEYYFVN